MKLHTAQSPPVPCLLFPLRTKCLLHYLSLEHPHESLQSKCQDSTRTRIRPLPLPSKSPPIHQITNFIKQASFSSDKAPSLCFAGCSLGITYGSNACQRDFVKGVPHRRLPARTRTRSDIRKASK